MKFYTLIQLVSIVARKSRMIRQIDGIQLDFAPIELFAKLFLTTFVNLKSLAQIVCK